MKCQLCHLREATKTPHHIISGNGRRRACETVHSTVRLCVECHMLVHSSMPKGLALRLFLRRRLQSTYFSMGYEEDEVRRLMGGRLEIDEEGMIIK